MPAGSDSPTRTESFGGTAGPAHTAYDASRPFASFSSTMTGSETITGSWAESTHSVIWLTRGGKGRLPLAKEPRRPWGANLISLAVIVVTVLVAATNLIDVYGSPVVWAVAAVPAALLGALVALAGQVRALRFWWQIVFLLCCQWIVGPVVALNDTTIAHVVPSADTLSMGFIDTFGSFKYLIAVAPPIGDDDGSLMAVWTICLWMTFLAGLFALSSKRALSVLSTLPVAGTLAVGALLGTDSGFYPMVTGIAIAILVIVWLSWRWQLLELSRWFSATVILLLAVALAVGACLGIGQSRLTLRDRYDPPLSPYDYASPLSGMRSYVKDHKNDKLLTVTGLPAGTPVRLAVMDQFDGNVWNLSDSTAASDSSDYRRVGTRIPAGDDDAGRQSDAKTAGKRFTATFTIHQGLDDKDDKWMPLAGSASSVTVNAAAKKAAKTGSSSRERTPFYYNTGTDSAIIPSGLTAGMSYTESGMTSPVPSDKQIAGADAQPTSQPGTKDVPDSVGKFAASVAGGEDTAGAQAQALVSQLKDSGWFSHGLHGEYASLPGHGSYRVNALLAGTAMVGDSEQYASAMALMARELGLPSRVVLGFLPKNEDGDISADRTKTVNGVSTVEFTGNDIEAWVEINLEGYGWVAFYPTPKETKVPDENQNLTPPNPQTLVRQPPVPLTDPLRDEDQAHGKSALAGEDADNTTTDQTWARIRQVALAVAVWGSPVWLMLAVCGLILLIKAIALARLRRRGDPRRRVASGWQAIHLMAGQSGVDARGTRRDQAQAIARELDIDAAALTALGREADRAAFSGESVTDEQAAAYWKTVADVRKTMLASQSTLRRIRTRLSLRGVFHNVRILSSVRMRLHRHPHASPAPSGSKGPSRPSDVGRASAAGTRMKQNQQRIRKKRKGRQS
ncbi:DUF3488 and transglutaminase-like domain-containing protein [Bifidobacterium leontopitheci]|nr:transglutaminase domain-containing protein [Bifidobacterium leontopitheci]